MKIPLFPLGLVLFPGQTLPLHIFEERYKQMLQRCLRDRIPFGVVLSRDPGRGRGSPFQVGTMAQIVQTDEMPEGQCPLPTPHRGNCFHIIIHGQDRFRITSIDRREAEYLVAEIEPYPDEAAPEPAMLMVAQRVSAMFDDYYRHLIALSGGWQREATSAEPTLIFDVPGLLAAQSAADSREPGDTRPQHIAVPALPSEPRALANVIATELNIHPTAKQDLLEAPSALARLQREAEILAEETPQLDERLRQQNRRRTRSFGASN